MLSITFLLAECGEDAVFLPATVLHWRAEQFGTGDVWLPVLRTKPG